MRTRILLGILVSLAIAVLCSVGTLLDRADTLNSWYIDQLFRVRGPVRQPNDVMVLALDEESFRYFDIPAGQRWPRHLHAEMIRRLAKAGAAAVAFDVLFLGPSPDPGADDEFARELSRLPTVLGTVISRVTQSEGALETIQEPFEKFQLSSTKLGLVNLPDDNGKVRRFMQPQRGYETLATAAISSSERVKPGVSDLLNLYGPSRTILTYPVYQVLQNEAPFPDELLRGKVVFVGLSLQSGLPDARKDSFMTSFNDRGAVFGVELHATAAANLLEQSWITRMTPRHELVWGGIGLLVTSTVVTLLPPLSGASVLLVLLSLWSITAYVLFTSGFLLPGFTAAWFGLPVSYLLSTTLNYVSVRRDQEKIRRAFSFYLSPTMAREISKNPSALQLGGQEAVATALFTDLAGFTAISESMKAEDTAKMLNRYFSKVAAEVTRNNGTLVKFIGDAIFALWGSPIPIPEHARVACAAALAMQKATDNFNALGEYPTLITRIGVHTGPMLVGNLGSEERFDFTAIGDSVNLAARLEGANKFFGTSILISQATKEGIGEGFYAVCMGKIRVVGKQIPIDLFALFREPLPVNDFSQWNLALAAFSKRDWASAREKFTYCCQNPLLKVVASRYLDLLDGFESHPPDQSWAGEIELSTK